MGRLAGGEGIGEWCQHPFEYALREGNGDAVVRHGDASALSGAQAAEHLPPRECTPAAMDDEIV